MKLIFAVVFAILALAATSTEATFCFTSTGWGCAPYCWWFPQGQFCQDACRNTPALDYCQGIVVAQPPPPPSTTPAPTTTPPPPPPAGK